MKSTLVGFSLLVMTLPAIAESAQLVCNGKAWIWNENGNNEHTIKGIHIEIGSDRTKISGSALFNGAYSVTSTDPAEVKFSNGLKFGSINRFSGELNLSAYATTELENFSNAINAVCEKPNPLF
ncbi:MAG: hypothetical protein Hens3KO_12050 [Henriciella sp.]